MASIKDVARLAGVSIATVSRAINNLNVVSDDTRRKIEWAVKQLGYNPNLAARSLKQQSAKLLGFLVPDIENPYYATLAKRMESEASKAGYSLILGNTDGRITSEEHYLKLLAGRLVDGVFLCRGHIRESSIPGFKGKKIKLVVLEKSDEEDSRVSVMVDNLEVGRLVARHFLEQGHRRLACIMENRTVLPFARRMRGFVDVAEEGGAAVPPECVIEAGPRIADGRDAMRKLLLLPARTRPSAVYCTNDLLAFGALQAAFEAKLAVPGDVSVAGTDDVAQSSYMVPSLTTIRQPYTQIAVAALRMLFSNGQDNGADLLLPPVLVARQSSGPAPARHGKR